MQGSRAVSTPVKGATRRSAAALLLQQHTPGEAPRRDCISVYRCIVQYDWSQRSTFLMLVVLEKCSGMIRHRPTQKSIIVLK